MWMHIKCPDGTQREMYFQGNNKTRKKLVRTCERTMVDEGVGSYEESSLVEVVQVETGITDAEWSAKGKGKAGGKGKGKTKGGKADDAASSADHFPSRSEQISKLQVAIATSREFGDVPERLEAKLRELQATPVYEGRPLTYGQAKEAARIAKVAQERQSLKVVRMQFALDDETANLERFTIELIQSERIQAEALAKEVQQRGKAQSIAMAAQDANAEIDISAIMPAADDPNLCPAARLGLPDLAAALKAQVQAWALKSRDHQQQMDTDPKTGTIRKAEDLEDKQLAPDGDNALLDSSTDDVVMASAASVSLACSLATNPEEQRRLQGLSGATPSKNGGQAAPQAGAKVEQPTAAQKTAAEKKEREDKARARLQASTLASAKAKLAAADAEAANVRAAAQEDEDGLPALDGA